MFFSCIKSRGYELIFSNCLSRLPWSTNHKSFVVNIFLSKGLVTCVKCEFLCCFIQCFFLALFILQVHMLPFVQLFSFQQPICPCLFFSLTIFIVDFIFFCRLFSFTSSLTVVVGVIMIPFNLILELVSSRSISISWSQLLL